MKKMFRFGWIPLAALAAIGSANAADLPVKARPPAVAVFSWTGCYLGGYVGGAWSDRDGAEFTDLGQNGLGLAGSLVTNPFFSYSGGATGARIVPQHTWSADLDASVIGGGTLGCNWQFASSSFVIGIEAEGGYM